MAERNNWMNENNVKTPSSNSIPTHSGGGVFEIQVRGQLDSRWSEWLEGLEMKLLDNGEMILFGPIVDQAALMGLLNKLSHLNLTLLSVNKVSKLGTR